MRTQKEKKKGGAALSKGRLAATEGAEGYAINADVINEMK